MDDSITFTDRQVRLIQIGLLVIIIVVVAVLMASARHDERQAAASAPEPEGALARLGRGTIEQLSVSPDGRTLAVRTSIGLYVYRADDLRPLWQVNEQEIYQVGFSPDGRILWGMTDEGLAGWDATNGARRLLLDNLWRETGGSLWRDGPHRWAVEWQSGLPHILAAPAPCRYQNEILPEPLTLVCIDFIDLPSGLLIDQLPTVIQLRSREDPRPLPDQPVSLYLDYSPHVGEFFILVQDRLWIWDLDRLTLSAVQPLPGNVSAAPALSPDATEVLLASGPTVYVYDRSQLSLSLIDTFPDSVLSLQYTLDGGRILIGTAGGEVLELGRISRWVIERHAVGSAIGSLVWTQEPDVVLFDAGTGEVVRWRISSEMVEGTIAGFLAPPAVVAWSPQEAHLITVTRVSTLQRDDPRLLSMWNLDGMLINQRRFGERIIGVAWSPDGQIVAVGSWSRGGSVQWLEADSFDIRQEFIVEGEGLCGLSWSSDGRLAVATADLRLLLFETGSFIPLHEIDARDLWVPPAAACRGVVWSPDGSLIAMEIANGSPLFWNSAEGHPITELNPDPLDNQASTSSIGWDANGSPLIAGYDSPLAGQDLEQRVSGIQQPSIMWIERQADRVEITVPGIPADMAWSPDGQSLAIAYQEYVEIIRLTSGMGLTRQMLDGHRDSVVGLEWSPAGEFLASYSLDGSVVIWQFNE